MTNFPSVLFLRFLWILVGFFFVLNVLFLVFSEPTNPSIILQQEIEADRKAFDMLSYWQGLLNKTKKKFDVPTKPSRYDGMPIDVDYQELAVNVMIDNFSLARPQHAGIRQASIVTEALVEGGITRLMLTFPYQELDRVGPVRSARDYFVDFATPFGGVYAHAGGSPSSLEKLELSDRLWDLDENETDSEQKLGKSYSFRDDRYEPPHNLFFDLLLTREQASQNGVKAGSTERLFCFEDTILEDTPSVHKIALDYSNELSTHYAVLFRYDSEQNVYKRFYGIQQLTPHLDSDRLQVSPRNVIVLIVSNELIPGDEKERIRLHHIGRGKAFFYRNGGKVEGVWEKLSEQSPTRYRDRQGQEICLLPGQTWISLIGNEELIKEN